MKDLSSHIMDIVQNSIRAEATEIIVRILENPEQDVFLLTVRDNGCGMDKMTLEKVRDPFFTSRTVRKVGLGIPLLQQNAERTGGKVTIISKQGKGTTIEASFGHAHWDRPPLGDIAEMITLLVAANPKIHFIYKHTTNNGQYRFDTEEIKQILEGIPPSHPEILPVLQNMIRENLKDIRTDRTVIQKIYFEN